MVKDPVQECEKLSVAIKTIMLESRLVAFTDLDEGTACLTRHIIFWQDFNPTYLLTLDYSQYDDTGKFRTRVTKTKRTADGTLVHGHPTYIKSAPYKKKKDFIATFEKWLKKEIKPRHTPSLAP
jgi:hypothetical protein